MNLFDLSLRLNGFPIAEAKKKLEAIQKIPEAQYKEYVTQKKLDIVKYHQQHNSFYRKLTAGIAPDSWDKLPVLTKKNLQQPLAERLSTGYTVKNVYVNKTSGSSGHPFIFAKDKFCHAMTWAYILNRFALYGIDFNTSLQARFYGIPLDKFGYTKERLKDYFSNRYRFPIFDLSDDVLKDFLKKFETKEFDYINGYTSSIVLFAKYLKRNNINLLDICPSLNYCFTTSEMLFDEDKILLEDIFKIPVINEYGASELDIIAFTNKEDKFQLNTNTLYVELLDDQDNPVPHGSPGRIILTSFYNKAHPFIRYDIGDVGIIDPKSTDKTMILKKLIGRSNDVAYLPSGKTVPGLTFYYVTKSIIEDDANVEEFVIVQKEIDLFLIEYVSKQELSSTEIGEIKKALYQYLEPNLRLEFKRSPVLKRSNRGKLKQFISKLNHG